jgi:hypothetical protein
METEIIDEIIQLPIAERMEIIDKISKSLREDMGLTENDEPSPENRHAAYLSLKGALAVPGKTPPTDEEIKKEYADYLSEKYK